MGFKSFSSTVLCSLLVWSCVLVFVFGQDQPKKNNFFSKFLVDQSKTKHKNVKRSIETKHKGKRIQPTCQMTFKEEVHDGVCTDRKHCRFSVLDSDGTVRDAGGFYHRGYNSFQEKTCGSKGDKRLGCCAEVKCMKGHGHCIDVKGENALKCGEKIVRGQCPGATVCCPFDEDSFGNYQTDHFEKNKPCLVTEEGAGGVCRHWMTGECGTGWERGHCDGKEKCCPHKKDSVQKWKQAQLKKECDLVGPAAKYLDLDITMLLAFKKVESGGAAGAVRFECHLWRRDKKISQNNRAKMPCSIKPGDSFSKVSSESSAKAFMKAYRLDKAGAIRATSFGLFQVMGGYLLQLADTPEKALDLFREDTEKVSMMLLAMWFRDPSWGAKAAQRARKIKGASAKYINDWKFVVRRYNGPGQVEYYTRKLREAYELYDGSCPDTSSYSIVDFLRNVEEVTASVDTMHHRNVRGHFQEFMNDLKFGGNQILLGGHQEGMEA